MNVYLDNNATTLLSSEIKEEMLGVLEIYGNPSSLHKLGVAARNAVESSRKKVAPAIGCEADEIIFTSGGTESNNIAIQGFLRTTNKKHIVTTVVEHPSVYNIFKYMEAQGYNVSWVDVDEYGIVNPEKVEKSLRDDTALVSIMTANNEVGAIEPIKEIAEKIKNFSPEIAFHTDAVQAFGKMDMDVKEFGIDLMSLSAHKINGPKGVGALYIRKGLKIEPVYFGGHHERGLRPGTENTQGIVGFGKAAELAIEKLNENIMKLKELKKRLKEGIEDNIENIKINGHPDRALPNTLNVSFRNVEGEAILMMLDMEGICASTGSACSTGTLEPSRILLAMGLDPATAQGSIRFSMGKYNTVEEIDYVIEKLPDIVKQLRKMSPLEKISNIK